VYRSKSSVNQIISKVDCKQKKKKGTNNKKALEAAIKPQHQKKFQTFFLIFLNFVTDHSRDTHQHLTAHFQLYVKA